MATVRKEFGDEKYASAGQARGGGLDRTAAYDIRDKLYNRLASTMSDDGLENQVSNREMSRD